MGNAVGGSGLHRGGDDDVCCITGKVKCQGHILTATTVAPFLKDTLPKGHLSNKDRIIGSKFSECL